MNPKTFVFSNFENAQTFLLLPTFNIILTLDYQEYILHFPYFPNILNFILVLRNIISYRQGP